MKQSATFKVDGRNYQQRWIRCGKNCKTCQAGGHVAYYGYVPAIGGAPRGTWSYFGTHPPRPSGRAAPTCQCSGCDNPVQRLNQKYCSARCRVTAHQAAR